MPQKVMGQQERPEDLGREWHLRSHVAGEEGEEDTDGGPGALAWKSFLISIEASKYRRLFSHVLSCVCVCVCTPHAPAHTYTPQRTHACTHTHTHTHTMTLKELLHLGRNGVQCVLQVWSGGGGGQ